MRKNFLYRNYFLRAIGCFASAMIFLSSCADDQTPDVNNQSATANGDSATAQSQAAATTSEKKRREPKDMHDSTVTRLALLQTEANQYRLGTQFITILQPQQTHDDSLKNRGYGKWYKIDLKRPFNVRNKEKLTLHIHGYLTYHDMAAKDPPIRHTLFLKWHGQGANLDSVSVWISPAPIIQAFELSDPPRPKVPPPPPME